MNYVCGDYVFKTEEEANRCRNLLMGRTGVVYSIFNTLRRVTHQFNFDTNKIEEKKKND